MPAKVAIRHNPTLVKLAKRLRAGHKKRESYSVCGDGKLVQLAYGVQKSGRPYDPEIRLAR